MCAGLNAIHRFVLELPDNQASLLPVASCLVVRASDPETHTDSKGKPIIRPYTPISSPDHKGELVLLIKRYENGNQSKYIHTLKVVLFLMTSIITIDIILQEGDSLALKGPFPKFPYKGKRMAFAESQSKRKHSFSQPTSSMKSH